MSEPDGSRLSTELELLEAMYPDQTSFNPKSRDLKFFDQSRSAFLHLRIPELYPDTGLPDVISACDTHKNDLRDRIKLAIRQQGLMEGEEALDAIIACFQNMIAATDNSNNDPESLPETDTETSQTHSTGANTEAANRTVIVWLHHLLALTKRKLAISPSGPVSGITKPGYPGILVFSGPAHAVAEHVNILKAQNWQAFQVRYEEEGLWEFKHKGVVEVESMAEVVKAVEVGEYGAKRKEEFLKAAGIK